MRKLDRFHENPFDNYIIDLVDLLCPLFKKMKFTPNGITTLSLIFGVLSIYFLYYYKFTFFSICFLLSYFFDCMDGHYARKYKMISKFGDSYDHFKDWSVGICLLFVVFTKYKINNVTILILIISTFLFATHMGCQEKVYEKEKDKKESATLEIFKKLCLGNCEESIKITRFFGGGTWNILFVFCIFFLKPNF